MSELTFPMVIDSTMRSDFIACPHKFYWGWIRKRQPKSSNVHLHFGGCFAKGLEVFRKKFYGERLARDAAESAAILEMISFWGDFEAPFNSAKNLERCLGALSAYLNNWNPSTDHVQPHIQDGRPLVEFNFAIPLPVSHPETGEPICYAGRYDMVAEYNNMLLVEDDKTTSQLGQSWVDQWALRGQITGYVWAAKQFGLPVAGGIIRGVSILKNSYGFAESLQLRPDWHIQRWYNQLIRDIDAMIACWRIQRAISERGSEPRDAWDQRFGDACNSYGGCTFSKLCTVSDPEAWVDQFFVERTWNPLNPEQITKES